MSLLNKIFKKKNGGSEEVNTEAPANNANLDNGMGGVTPEALDVLDNNVVVPMMENNVFSENGMGGQDFSSSNVANESSPLQVFSSVSLEETNNMEQVNNDGNLNVSGAVLETGAVVDNPTPNVLVDNNISVNPSDLFQGEMTKEDEITNIVQQDVNMEEAQSNMDGQSVVTPVANDDAKEGTMNEPVIQNDNLFAQGEISLEDALGGTSVLAEGGNVDVSNLLTPDVNQEAGITNPNSIQNNVTPNVVDQVVNGFQTSTDVSNNGEDNNVVLETPVVEQQVNVQSEVPVTSEVASVENTAINNENNQTVVPEVNMEQNIASTQEVVTPQVEEVPVQQSIISDAVMSQYQNSPDLGNNVAPMEQVPQEPQVAMEPFASVDSGNLVDNQTIVINNNIEPSASVPSIVNSNTIVNEVPVATPPQRKTRFCDNCGEMITDNSKVCPNCGEIL